MKPLHDCRLYTFVDTGYLSGCPATDVAKKLCDGGSDIIQLRAKSSSADEVQRMADAIAPITERAGVHLVINDHLSLARRMPRPFVHLGQEDFFDAGHTQVSELQTPNSELRVGLSSHAPEQALRAVMAGADYVAIGPIFPTATKPSRSAVTLDYVRWASSNVQIPWFAIGGINLENLDQVIEAGARRICVVSAILQAPDIARACQQFRQRLLSASL
ncbi:MAG: thiamine phosphate synthase [Pedosphaera sp.]|nr:thiamine phosphate synthase [Pedosphaera sp.]